MKSFELVIVAGCWLIVGIVCFFWGAPVDLPVVLSAVFVVGAAIVRAIERIGSRRIVVHLERSGS